MNEPKPPIEKNKHEAGIELLWERIQIAIEQMPVPISDADNARLAAADAKMWEALDVLTGSQTMNATLDLAEVKARILSGLTELLHSRRGRLQGALRRGDLPAVAINTRHLNAEEARFVELAASNDWDFWNRHRDTTPDVLFIDLEAARKESR